MRYCRPWMIPAIDAELEFKATTREWLSELRLALREIEGEMAEISLARRQNVL